MTWQHLNKGQLSLIRRIVLSRPALVNIYASGLFHRLTNLATNDRLHTEIHVLPPAVTN